MDEQTAQEEMEDKLKQCIDNLMDKRYLFYSPVTINKKKKKGNVRNNQTQYQTVVDIAVIELRCFSDITSLSLFVSPSVLRRVKQVWNRCGRPSPPKCCTTS